MTELRLRVATPADGAAIADVYAPYVSEGAVSFELTPPDSSEMRARVMRTLPQFPWLVAEEDGVVRGYAYASEHRSRLAYRWSVDVAIYMDESIHGRGVGRRLYTALFTVLRAQSYVNAYAGIALPNEASVGLHEAMGFKRLGIYRNVGFKSGAWRDVGWWALALTQLPVVPREPTPFAKLSPGGVRVMLQAGSVTA